MPGHRAGRQAPSHDRTSRARSGLLVVMVGLLALALPASAATPAATKPRKAIWGPAEINGKSMFPIYRQLGVSIYSLAIDWSTVAPRRPREPRDPNDPAYEWPPQIKRKIALANSYGIDVNLEITYAPKWSKPRKDSQYLKDLKVTKTTPWKRWAPIDAKDFGDFAAAAARKYPNVRMWMIWGEPSRTHNFMPYDEAHGKATTLTPGQARGPRKYAELVDAAYGALKSVHRDNLVIGGSTFTGGNIRTPLWIKYMRLPNGKPPRMDLYSHNPFSFREPNLDNPPSRANNVDFSDLERLEDIVVRNLGAPYGKSRIPLFLSEWCIPTAKDGEFNYKVTEAEQARWINSAFRILNGRGRSFIHSLGWIHVQDGQGSKAGLLRADGSKKPGYWAFANG